jgi:hypothetical protein
MAAQMALYVHDYVFRTQKMCGQTSNGSANNLWLVKVVLIG